MSRSSFQQFHWQSAQFGYASNDIDAFYSLLGQQMQRLGMLKHTLGHIEAYPLDLYQSPEPQATLPNILISAGFHGEEAAGPWGMLKFLSALNSEVFKQVNLSLLPLVNPTGFKAGHRFNQYGENPNRGFEFEAGKAFAGEGTSAEGVLLLAQQDLLKQLSGDGILTCHEDVLQHCCYVYSFEPQQAAATFSYGLRDSLAKYFKLAADNSIDGCPLEDGLIHNHYDTSFESCLVRLGAKQGACSETPALEDFDQRINANCAVMQQFVALSY
ncbi:N-acetyl-ornithine deacetylase [Agarivorans sp. MS3-6]|uniref:N-acetyl-ornithine deacetylase n=1 Tax=Agarivorans sp. TSD2052 TaxID=2937286 RepID=UPI00200C02F4|nr:M14 family metallocarboxypeptidase [Agarivorans sp. TSD2052]UPW17548.1 M14 family metallocarboxypeptidase [Agarivorans sp. TSD2052]